MWRLSIFGVAAFFASMGLVGLLRPRRVVEIFGGRADTAQSRSEVRAVYGGFGLVVALMLAWAARRPEEPLARGLVLAVALALTGMAAGRLLGACLERDLRPYPTWAFFAVELLLAALLAGWAYPPALG